MPEDKKKLLSQRCKIIYFVSVTEKRILRKIKWIIDDKKYSKHKSEKKLQFRVKKHQSRLLKKLGESDMILQYNKVDNLKIVAEKINGLLIKPGETFSFAKAVGKPTKRKGYKLGMELSYGKAQAGIGGGICQSSNLLFWLALHSPLTITERHHHSFDPFPDDGRVLPWASGATVFYNYLDFQITNNTENTFQFNLWLSETELEGEIRSNKELDFTYHVFEKEHKFLKINEEYYRQNEIWRNIIEKKTGNILKAELITKNFGRVMYIPENVYIDNQ